MVDIHIDGHAALLEEFQVFPPRAQRAIVRALNRAIASARTLVVREVARDIGLKVSDVRAATPQSQATSTRPEARIWTNLKRIPLIKFSARGPEPSRGRGRGVTYRIGAGRSRGRVDRGFIATMASGHRGVFQRRGPGRLPVVELRGPSLGHIFAKHRAAGLAKAVESFESNLDHEIDFASRRGRG